MWHTRDHIVNRVNYVFNEEGLARYRSCEHTSCSLRRISLVKGKPAQRIALECNRLACGLTRQEDSVAGEWNHSAVRTCERSVGREQESTVAQQIIGSTVAK